MPLNHDRSFHLLIFISVERGKFFYLRCKNQLMQFFILNALITFMNCLIAVADGSVRSYKFMRDLLMIGLSLERVDHSQQCDIIYLHWILCLSSGTFLYGTGTGTETISPASEILGSKRRHFLPILVKILFDLNDSF